MKYILWFSMIMVEVLRKCNLKVRKDTSLSAVIRNKRIEKARIAKRKNIEFIEKVDQKISENFANGEISVIILAQLMNMSRTSFTTKIKIATNQTPGKYLQEYKMRRAVLLLLSSHEIQISEVAYAVGFADPKYFGIVFKKYYGISPSEYRKRHANDISNQSI